MPISDTKPEIQAMRDRIIMGMTGEQRLRLALEMSSFSHELAKAGIRDAHPDWSDEQVQREFLRSLFLPGKAPSGF
jgi:hypothetical protein